MSLSANGLYPMTGCFLTLKVNVDGTTGSKIKDLAVIEASTGNRKWNENIPMVLRKV